MKRYIKPNTEVVLMQSEPVMAPISGGGKASFTTTLSTTDASGDVLGKENEITSTSLWDDEEE